ncbi:MAG: sigma-54-dependent Fis family transcriptional regulator [Sterolibacteriaceae bacterium]|nr:sigma-54-dependent Fis family transcriptional regulator [Candidatus Methylophosphatis haderslevensis]
MSNNVAEHARSVYTAVSDAARGSTPQELYARSWVRCVNDYGLDPTRSLDPRTVSAEDLRIRTERLGELVPCGKLEMANLYQQLADSQSAVVLTDSDGVVVCLVGDPGFTRAAARHGMVEGAIWSEEEQGTNGMGTCLKERSPIVIHRAQHFLARNTNLTCTAAPIFDSQGNLAAVLDLSSQSRLAQQHSTVLVSMAAQMIENRTFLAEHKQAYIVRFHSRPEFVYTLHEGELAMSAEGKVIAANRGALFQLGFGGHDEIVGADVGTLFNTSLPDLISRCVKSSFHPVPLYGARQGSRFFAVAQQPARLVQPFRDAVERHAARRSATGSTQVLDNRLQDLEFGDERMASNVRCAMRVLNRNIPILLIGETGSGKEVFSKAMHAASSRAGGPFVAVNCASIPDTLIESELFGYKSGAFTGASREGRRGKIIQANGGTLFLDEIGDMPLHLQARLLRVLEEREVVPLGSEMPIPVNVQLISATHRNLQDMLASGEFREDLYYRLQGISITLPPLRVRKDKPQLIERALGDECESGRVVRIDAAAMRVLENYAWPGNLRQLRNVIRTALALCDSDQITVKDLPAELLLGVECQIPPNQSVAAPADSGLNSLESAEREALLQVLERHRWNITSLAQELDTSRNTIYRKMKRLNIDTVNRDRNEP